MTFKEFLEDFYTDIRFINKDLEYIAIAQFAFTHAIIKGTVGNTGNFDDRWCYHAYADARKAIELWDGKGDPIGWHRNPKTGRRREGGDPAKEYINF